MTEKTGGVGEDTEKMQKREEKCGVRVSFPALVTWVQNTPLEGNLKRTQPGQTSSL